MKKIINSLIGIVFISIILIGIDFYSIYKDNKPVFVIKEEIDGLNKVYRGILYDTFNCIQYSSMQIKLKNTKYSCPRTEKNTDENDKKIAKLTFVGDLLFEQPYYDAISNGEDKDKYFNRVKEYFINDDISIGNMEVVIGNDKLKPSGTGYNFCAPEYIGDLVNTLSFEVLSTANNHAYDRGIDGIYSTIDYFKNNTDILTIGTYKTKEDRESIKLLEVNDIKFGFLAYTYGTNQKISNENSYMIAYYKDPIKNKITEEYKNIIKEEVENAKKISDVVIVLMHWGNEFTFTPNKEQKEMAIFLNELGVDIIVGSHSHNIEPIEIIGDEHKTLVYYSLGNFLSSDDDIARTKEGVETFDNAYQFGLLSKIEIVKENEIVEFQNINTELIINYFDNNMRNFELVPYKEYNEKYETTHYRYSKGLTKDFITEIYNNIISKDYQKNET